MNLDGNEPKGPSVAELQRFIRNETNLEFLLVDGERLTGKLNWFDGEAFSVTNDDEEPVTILRSAVIAYKVST